MKPFTSYDGADARGVRAEVAVQVGEGTVAEIEGLDGEGRNVQVLIKSSHGAVRKPIKGWLQRTDPLLAKVVEAKDSGAQVTYRVEAQRKSEVDRSLPIGPLRETVDLARENCINIFAGLNGMLSQEAVTNPAEDPAPGGRIPASSQAPAPGGSAPSAGGGGSVDLKGALRAIEFARRNNLPDGVLHAAIAQALAVGASMEQVQAAGFDQRSNAEQPPQQSAFASEAPAYKMFNTDGRPNLGSYAVGAMFGAERFAIGLIADKQEQDAGEGEVAAPVDLAQAAALADVLIGIADRVQVETAGGGRADRTAQSHIRARSLVFDSIERRHPVPFGGDTQARTEWADAIVAECIERFRHLVTLAIKPPQQAVPQETPQQQAPQDAPQQPSAQQGPPAQDAPSQAAATQAPQETPQQQPQQDAPAQQAERARPLTEGDPGFQEPTGPLIDRFASLAQAAGFTPTPDSPITAWMTKRFGVQQVRKINAADLSKMLDWYESRGDAAVSVFTEHVMTDAGLTQQAG